MLTNYCDLHLRHDCTLCDECGHESALHTPDVARPSCWAEWRCSACTWDSIKAMVTPSNEILDTAPPVIFNGSMNNETGPTTIQGRHCQQCGSTDLEDLDYGDQGYTACCNEIALYPDQNTGKCDPLDCSHR